MKKVAIVGTAPTSVMDAPYDDVLWDIWSLGANQVRIKRFTRWFELHDFHTLECADVLKQAKLDFFKKIGKDLWLGHKNEFFPDAMLYPKDAVVAEFGNYFTSSIAWMIALAVHEGYEEIGLWGIDMIGDGEYSHQRPCCEYFLGIARGKGITITISPHSPLLRAERLYAFEYTNFAGELLAMQNEAKASSDAADVNYVKSIEDKAFARGALTVLNNLQRKWG